MSKKSLGFFVLISVLLFIITLGVYSYYFSAYSVSLNPANWAHFGDYFSGVLSPIFSLFAFFGLLYSLHFQYKAQYTANIEKSYLLTVQQLDQSLESLFSVAPSRVFYNDYLTYKHIFIAFKPYENDNYLNYPDSLFNALESFTQKERKEYAHFSEMKWVFSNLKQLSETPPDSLQNTPLIIFYQKKVERLKLFFDR